MKDEIYEILYETNTFVLSPNKPDLCFTSKGQPIVSKRQQWGPVKHVGTGIMAGDGRGFLHTFRAIECFFHAMSSATCARVCEIQLFVGQPIAAQDYKAMPNFVRSNFPLFPKVIVTTVPHLYNVSIFKSPGAQITIQYQSQLSYCLVSTII